MQNNKNYAFIPVKINLSAAVLMVLNKVSQKSRLTCAIDKVAFGF